MIKENKLIIIGNGFDLYHNLNTSYIDFKKWLFENDYNLFVKINEYVVDNFFGEELDENWSNIENALYLNYERIKDSELYLGIFNRIQNVFERKFVEWISEIDKKIGNNRSIKKFKWLTNDDYYLSFNYTNTLNKIYDLNNNYSHVYYIHGNVDDPEDSGINKLTFGNCRNNNYTKEDEEAIYSFKIHFCKDTESKINYLNNWINGIDNVTYIIVIGCYIDFVNGDFVYYDFISKRFFDAEWIITYHTSKDKEHLLEVVKKLKIKYLLVKI